MELLNPGVLPVDQVQKLRGACTNCKAEVEVDWQEARLDIFYGHPIYSVSCPTKFCFQKIRVKI